VDADAAPSADAVQLARATGTSGLWRAGEFSYFSMKPESGTCAGEGSSDYSFSVAGENGKCGANCDCPAGTCAKEGSSSFGMGNGNWGGNGDKE
jgi:hypothetical protein